MIFTDRITQIWLQKIMVLESEYTMRAVISAVKCLEDLTLLILLWGLPVFFFFPIVALSQTYLPKAISLLLQSQQ